MRCINTNCGCEIPDNYKFCMNCGTQVLYSRSEEHWIEKLAKDPDLWIENTEEWPSVVAYEYRRLRDLCRSKVVYGALLSLKDNFETIIKLEVLLSFAWAGMNKDDSFKNEIISLITTPDMALGSWVELGQRFKDAIKTGDRFPHEIPIAELTEQFYKYGIAGWRNSEIAHGAMKADDDESFRRDIEEKITILRDILLMMDEDFIKQQFFIDDIRLRGYENARDLPGAGKVICKLKSNNGEIEIDVDPFIVVREHDANKWGVYFFDNQKTKTLSMFLAYTEGKRTSELNDFFSGLRSRLDRIGININTSPLDPDLENREERELESLQMTHGFIRPEKLVKWLSESIREHKKGILLLQMDRGTGKSVFADKLDRLYGKNIEIEKDLDVRTYHYSRSQSVGTGDVRNRIEWLWANQKNSLSWQRIIRIQEYEDGGNSHSKAFSLFLANVRRHTEHVRGRKKILMVLDGLDEIVDDELWKMIPKEEDLAEGVYILLTSRNPDWEKLPDNVCEHLKRITPTEKLLLSRSSDEYKVFLSQYIKNNEIKGLSQKQRDKLIMDSDRRVIYLGLLCQMIESGISISEIDGIQNIISTYLKSINERYGKKESIRVREVLTVISTLGELESLTLNEIGKFTSFQHLTLELIGVVRDLLPILKTERSESGNRYKVANPKLANELCAQLPEKNDVIREMIQLGLNQIIEGCPLDCDEAKVVISHIVELALLLPEKTKVLGENFDIYICRFIERVKRCTNCTNCDMDTDRLSDYVFEGIKYFDLLKQDRFKNYIGQYMRIQDYSVFFMNHNMHNAAIDLLQKLLGYYEQDSVEDEPISDTKYHLACIMYKINNTFEAEKLFLEVIESREKAADSRDKNGKQKLAVSYNQIAYLYYRLGDFERAKDYYNKALKIQEEIFKTDKGVSKDYSFTLNNYAVLMHDLGVDDTAEKYHLRAMEIREEMAQDGLKSSRGWLAMSCLNYAKFLYETYDDYINAERLFIRAMELYKGIKSKTDYAIAKYAYGKMVANTNIETALKIQIEVYNYRRELEKTNHRALQSDISDSQFEIGKLLIEQGKRKEAVSYLKDSLKTKRELAEISPGKHGKALETVEKFCEGIV